MSFHGHSVQAHPASLSHHILGSQTQSNTTVKITTLKIAVWTLFCVLLLYHSPTSTTTHLKIQQLSQTQASLPALPWAEGVPGSARAQHGRARAILLSSAGKRRCLENEPLQDQKKNKSVSARLICWHQQSDQLDFWESGNKQQIRSCQPAEISDKLENETVMSLGCAFQQLLAGLSQPLAFPPASP